MMIWACELILITGGGRDLRINRKILNVENRVAASVDLRTWLAGPVPATLRDSL